jgi:hypothetical protein
MLKRVNLSNYNKPKGMTASFLKLPRPEIKYIDIKDDTKEDTKFASGFNIKRNLAFNIIKIYK